MTKIEQAYNEGRDFKTLQNPYCSRTQPDLWESWNKGCNGAGHIKYLNEDDRIIGEGLQGELF